MFDPALPFVFAPRYSPETSHDMFRASSGTLLGGSIEDWTTLRELTEHSILQNNLETAEFQAELLSSLCGAMRDDHRARLDSAYLYGYVLYLRGKYTQAALAVRTHRDESFGCCYVLARCALQLDEERCSETLRSLVAHADRMALNGSGAVSEALCGMPDEATLHAVLGHLYHKLERFEESSVSHARALALNPYLWESLRALCDMRAGFSVGKLYRKRPDPPPTGHHIKLRRGLVGKPHTPFKVPGTDAKKKQANGQQLQQPFVRNRSIPTSSLLKSTGMASAAPTATPTNAFSRPRLLTTPPSKFMNTDKSVTPEHLGAPSTFGGPNLNFQLDGIFFALAKSYKSACKYDCYKAIRILNEELPKDVLETMPFVLANLGKLHFEVVNYEMARKYFTTLRDIQPARLTDMEIFSTLLWHLHDQVGLSNLCHELLDIDRLAPETWCCIGNLFSLNKDHEESIKAFQRATQLNSKFTYAYTLQGHEYASNDAFDTAKTCYRKALATNSQHYNAYYGLGMCCLKLGQYEECLLHFEKARSINPVNVILICCCGVALEKLNHQEKALQYYELACELQPMSSLSLFKKAQLLLAMGKYNSALENFEKLVSLAPDEATVHFLLGQLYQIVGRKQEAVKELTIAMNLDPKGNQLIKSALEKCHQQD